MKNIQLLDVTLRDGGYKTNFYFQSEIIRNVLTALDNSGIQYIEIGYRNGSFKPVPNIGPVGLCDKRYLDYCNELIKKSKMTVILHPKNVFDQDFSEMKNLRCKSCKNMFFNSKSRIIF